MMERVRLSEVKNLVEYEKVRDAMRARIIGLKQNRRVSVGDNLTFLFENRDTVLFQIQEMVRTERVRRTINRFQGLDRQGVGLRLGERPAVPARFEEGHSKEEKMAAVHYLRFRVPPEARDVLADPRERVRLVVSHPNYRAEADVPPATRAELIADLRS